MDYEQAWQSVLGQLQMEMPRASFQTWVRDTRPLSFEDGILTIGVRNAYAREWLESRLASTISRLLIGILDSIVTVTFVVTQEDEDLEESPEEETCEDGFSVEVVTSTRYTDEVNPDRIVLIPGYALRLLKHGDLTPKEMSLWIGFRQAVFRQWRQGRRTVKNIPHWEVIRFAMMSRASYFRELSGKDSLAGDLVEVVPEPAQTGPCQSRRWENANRYRVHMMPRLTRSDCAALESILTSAANTAVTLEEAQSQVSAALESLLTQDPGEFLEQVVEPGASPALRSIMDVVRRVLGLEGDMPDDLATAAEQLYDKIMNSFGKVLITHYFLREVVPILGLTHPQAWMIIMLRDHCWYDYETGTQKNFAVVPGGTTALTEWIGVTRKAFDGWLAKPEFAAFVRRADVSKLEVIPDDWHRNRTDIFLVTQTEPLLGAALDEAAGKKRDSKPEKVRLVPGKSETRYWKKRDSILEKMRLDLGKSETPLNNLIKPLLTHRTSKAITNRPSSQSSAKYDRERRSGGRDKKFSDWDLENLFRNLAINPTTRTRLQEAKLPPWALVAWLLRAITLKGVEDPVGFAITRVASRKTRYSAGDDFELLAKSPEKLLREIKRVLHPYRYGLTLDDQRDAFKRAFSSNRSLASTLWHLLTGEDECEGVKVVFEKKRVVFESAE